MSRPAHFEQRLLTAVESIAAALESQPIGYVPAELDATECTDCCHHYLPEDDEIVGQRVTVASDIREGDRFTIAGVAHVVNEEPEVGTDYVTFMAVCLADRRSDVRVFLPADAQVTVTREAVEVTA